MPFEIVGELSQIETIAAGRRIRDLQRLRRLYGPGRWRKLKGVANEAQAICRLHNVKRARVRASGS